MSLYSFDSSAPVVKSETLTISWYTDLRGLNRSEPVEFEQEVHWVRHCETTCVLGRDGARPLKEGSSYTDTRGYLHSIYPAFEDALQFIEPYGLDPESKLQVRIETTIVDRPVVQSPEAPFYRSPHMKKWIQPPASWIVGNKEVAKHWRTTPIGEHDLEQSPVLRDSPIFVGELWSSREMGKSISDQLALVRERLTPAFEGYAMREGDLTLEHLVASISRMLEAELQVPA